MSAPALLSLLQSCQSQPRLDWKPIFLSEDQARFVSVMVDTWLPKTATPGALDVKVDMFIDLVFAKVYDKEAQDNIVAEMEKFDGGIKEQYGSRFVDLSEEDRKAAMQDAESQGAKYNGKVWGTAVGEQEPVGFYRSLKSMALWGYFTSEEIGKNVLTYDPIPGSYQGCIPLSDVGNSWSF